MKLLRATNLPVMLRGSLVVLLVAARCARAFDAELKFLEIALREFRERIEAKLQLS